MLPPVSAHIERSHQSQPISNAPTSLTAYRTLPPVSRMFLPPGGGGDRSDAPDIPGRNLHPQVQGRLPRRTDQVPADAGDPGAVRQ